MKYPAVRFAVIADPHYYSPSLGIDTPAFRQMLASTRDIKLLADSAEIFGQVITEIIAEKPDFLFVVGDLTKDGEESSHLDAAAQLQRAAEQGISVIVINGNHDINNPKARSYLGSRAESLRPISMERFRSIYEPFGPRQAFTRDANSLSYAVELHPDLWVLAFDSCQYQPQAQLGGTLGSATLAWAERILDRASETGTAVIGLMHHGLLQHYSGNERFYPKYILKGYQETSARLAAAGLQLVFTGHFHAQNIQRRQLASSKFIYDIETASLVTFPCMYRSLEINADQQLRVLSRPVRSIPSRRENFRSYAREYCYNEGVRVAAAKLRKLHLRQSDAECLAPQIIDAFEAHCTGDGRPRPPQVLDLKGIGPWGRFVMKQRRVVLEGLWQENVIPSNDVVIDLQTGMYRSV